MFFSFESRRIGYPSNKGGEIVGKITVTGAIIIVTAWITLIEYDHLPEEERQKVINAIKTKPKYFLLLSLMPLGILFNVLGTIIRSPSFVLTGATLLILQALFVSFVFWNRTRWKSVFLFIVTIILGVFLYFPLFL